MSFNVVKCSFPDCNQLIVYPDNIPPTNVGHANIIVSVRTDKYAVEPLMAEEELQISDGELQSLKHKIIETSKIKQDGNSKRGKSKILYCPNAHPNIVNFKTKKF